MLSEAKFNLLSQEIKTFTREELVWFNGYLSGLLAQTQIEQPVAAVEVKVKPTIIYGSETGNAKRLATQLQALLKKNKIQAKVVDASQYALDKLSKEEYVIGIMSTQGEGEPPINATTFFDTLSTISIDIPQAKYAVFALGDSSYPLFCKAGEDLDVYLSKIGAQQVIPLQKSDVDYQSVAEAWFQEVLNSLQNAVGSAAPKAVLSSNGQAPATKKNFEGLLKHKVVLNDRGSNKETYHLEIASEEEIAYEPGDAIGFYPKNKEIETRFLAAYFKEEERFAELESLNIKGLSAKSVAKFASLFELTLKEEKIDLIDLLEKYAIPSTVKLDQIIELLHPIAPRLYSISSAAEAHEDEIHITVNLNTFTAQEKAKTGHCSDFLANFPVGDTVPFYIHKNNNFRLPTEDKDIIMIGPGTGIAPFRSFLAHRDATGAEGRNWLFFGEQHFVSDFYYQTELQEWLYTGVLTKLSTAFSRDQKHKIYVQDRIKEEARELVQWLDDGAYLYICGQKDPMSTDVEQTLHSIISEVKNISIDDAKEYLETLESERRYQKDVY